MMKLKKGIDFAKRKSYTYHVVESIYWKHYTKNQKMLENPAFIAPVPQVKKLFSRSVLHSPILPKNPLKISLKYLQEILRNEPQTRQFAPPATPETHLCSPQPGELTIHCAEKEDLL